MTPGRTIRVFPRRTSCTPTDDYAFYGLPPFVIPEHDEVHISCTFTWDKAWAEELAFQWQGRTDRPVRLGGPAFGSEAADFTQGLYLKPNIVFTTRGCNNNCPWCIVPKLEGRLKELEIVPGNMIQDNNFLQASRAHKDRVFSMLKKQTAICFKGGLEAGLIDGHFVDGITSLRIKELWLACDTDAKLPGFKRACAKLKKAGFPREKIRCYALSYGKDRDRDEAGYLSRALELLRPNRKVNIPDLESMIRVAAKNGFDLCDYCRDINCRDCVVNEWKEGSDGG